MMALTPEQVQNIRFFDAHLGLDPWWLSALKALGDMALGDLAALGILLLFYLWDGYRLRRPRPRRARP
jgi:hypothetical protein